MSTRRSNVIDLEKYIQTRDRALILFLHVMKYIHETVVGNYYLVSVGKFRKGSKSMKLIKLYKTIRAAGREDDLIRLCQEITTDGRRIFCTRHPLIFLKSLLIVMSWHSRAIRHLLDTIREKGYLTSQDREQIIRLLQEELDKKIEDYAQQEPTEHLHHTQQPQQHQGQKPSSCQT